MCLNHVGGWFSKTQRDKKFDPGYWIKFLEPPCQDHCNSCNKVVCSIMVEVATGLARWQVMI